jgi:hypothetical protein
MRCLRIHICVFAYMRILFAVRRFRYSKRLSGYNSDSDHDIDGLAVMSGLTIFCMGLQPEARCLWSDSVSNSRNRVLNVTWTGIA